jgi:hypothetical protein
VIEGAHYRTDHTGTDAVLSGAALVTPQGELPKKSAWVTAFAILACLH